MGTRSDVRHHVRQKVADRVQRPEAEVDQEPRSNDTASPQKQKAVVSRALRVWAAQRTHRAGMANPGYDQSVKEFRARGAGEGLTAVLRMRMRIHRVSGPIGCICTFCQSDVLLQCSK